MSDDNGHAPSPAQGLAPVPTALDTRDRKPWYRLPLETHKAYHAFCHYRDLPSWDRTMSRAYTDHQVRCRGKQLPLAQNGAKITSLHATPLWATWRLKFTWQERVIAHDSAAAEDDRLAKLRAIEEMNGRHQNLALALQNLAIGRLRQIAESNVVMSMSPRDIAAIIDKASQVERRARGAATSIVATTTSPDGPAGEDKPLNLSRLTDVELAAFEELLRKAHP